MEDLAQIGLMSQYKKKKQPKLATLNEVSMPEISNLSSEYEGPKIAMPEVEISPISKASLPEPTVAALKLPEASPTINPALLASPMVAPSLPQFMTNPPVTPQQQTLAPQPELIKPLAGTSPTEADKAFNKPVEHKGTTLTLPPNWGQPELDKAVAIAKKHGMEPREFFGMIAHESAGTFSPSIQNEIGATGLIQFTPTTSAAIIMDIRRAKAIEKARQEGESLGLPQDELNMKIRQAGTANPKYAQLSESKKEEAKALATKQIGKMGVADQLDLVDKYLKDSMRGEKGVTAAYGAVFRGKPTTTLIPAGTEAYENNKVLDKDNKNGITQAEWFAPVANKIGQIKDVRVAPPPQK